MVYTDSTMLEKMEQYCLSDAQKRYMVCKRWMDAVIAAAALMVLIVPMAVVAFIQKLCSPFEPVFFLQERVGLHGKRFQIIKFRTMRATAPHNIATNSFDGYFEQTTGFGRYLRKTSIDELPQLINVLKGEMALVGPRPLIPTEEPAQTLRAMHKVYDIRPGITGLAQVSGRDYLDDYEKVRFDRQYVVQFGIRQDISIILRSFGCVFRRENILESSDEIRRD